MVVRTDRVVEEGFDRHSDVAMQHVVQHGRHYTVGSVPCVGET